MPEPASHTCPELEAVNASHLPGNPDTHVVQVERPNVLPANADPDDPAWWRMDWACFTGWDEIEGDSFYTCSPIAFCPFCGSKLEATKGG